MFNSCSAPSERRMAGIREVNHRISLLVHLFRPRATRNSSMPRTNEECLRRGIHSRHDSDLSISLVSAPRSNQGTNLILRVSGFHFLSYFGHSCSLEMLCVIMMRLRLKDWDFYLQKYVMSVMRNALRYQRRLLCKFCASLQGKSRGLLKPNSRQRGSLPFSK